LIALQPHADGVLLPVRAQAAARQNALQGIHDGYLRVSVTQAPEKGKANKAIIKLLADQLGLRRSQIALLAGDTSNRKSLLVRDVTVDELSRRIRVVLQDAI
jgi:hypothetical protein